MSDFVHRHIHVPLQLMLVIMDGDVCGKNNELMACGHSLRRNGILMY